MGQLRAPSSEPQAVLPACCTYLDLCGFMSKTPENKGAYQTAAKARPLQVKPAPYTPPGENEVVVRNHAVAVNPLDWLKQATGDVMFEWIRYPTIMGNDLAGQVVEVGKGVTRLNIGDRVLGFAVGMDKRSNKSSECAFQTYTVIRANLASPIPSSMSYEDACVLPLCLSTAACALFMKDYLALEYPTLNPKRIGKTLLVWGGSTSVGSNAIQLATAAGYGVIATASPKNFGYVKKLGASQTFDYRNKAVVQDLIEAVKGKECAGAIAIGNGSLEACIDVVSASKGHKFVAQASIPLPDKFPTSMIGMVGLGLGMVWFNASIWIKSNITKQVGVKFVFGSDLMVNEVGAKIYEDFIPTALAAGKYLCAPKPQVVGKGLEFIQEALDTNAKGVSATKVVVTL